MKHLFLLLILGTSAFAQIPCYSSGPVTANLGLSVPAYNTQNWNTPVVADFDCIDNYLSGGTWLPAFDVRSLMEKSVNVIHQRISPGNPQGWSGSELGAWMQAADVACNPTPYACVIHVDAGSYSQTTTFTPNSNVILEGDGNQSTTIAWGSSSGTAITLPSTTAFVYVQHLGLTSTYGGTSTAIAMANSGNIIIDDVRIVGFGTQVSMTGDGGTANESSNVYIENSYFNTPAVAAITADHTNNIVFYNLQIVPGTNGPAIVFDSGINGAYLNQVNIFQAQPGLWLKCTGIHSTAGTCSGISGGGLSYNYPPWGVFVQQGTFDGASSSTDEIFFDSTLGANVIDFSCVQCWVTNGLNGIHISGGQKISWTSGGRIRGASLNGVLIDNPNVADVLIKDSFITNNNQSANADAHGVYVTVAASRIRLEGNRIGNITEPYGGGHQDYGVKVSANAPNFALRDFDLNGNATGPYYSTNTAVQSIGPGLPALTYVVSGLPTASSNPGLQLLVSDSTAVSAEGQTCVGSSSNTALAISTGSGWKCF